MIKYKFKRNEGFFVLDDSYVSVCNGNDICIYTFNDPRTIRLNYKRVIQNANKEVIAYISGDSYGPGGDFLLYRNDSLVANIICDRGWRINYVTIKLPNLESLKTKDEFRLDDFSFYCNRDNVIARITSKKEKTYRNYTIEQFDDKIDSIIILAASYIVSSKDWSVT